ncbi:MAG: ribosome small subunit-dependent GTPase A [Kofleriaceae bacterium]
MIGAEAPPGWDASWEAARAAADPDGALTAVRISAAHRGAYDAIAGDVTVTIELRGRQYRSASDKRDLPVVGDFCVIEGWDAARARTGAASLVSLLPRRSLLVRRAAGTAMLPQPLAANVDVALIVTSANSELSAPRLHRYLELARDGGISPAVILSKIDLAPDRAGLLAAVEALAPGVPVLATSALEGLGVAEARALVGAGKTGILLGSSGVGKSSLLNALSAGAGGSIAQATQAPREHDERGRHTTTTRQLFAVPDGSLWIDTPGMRELAAFAEREPDQAFDDVAALAARCRFADCQHLEEPGCAVARAVARGELTAQRLASFHKLRDERAADRARAAGRASAPPTRRPGARTGPRRR